MPSPWKVSPSPSRSDRISSWKETSIVSGGRALLAAWRPTEEVQRLRLRPQRRDADRFERLLELAALRVGERGVARGLDRRRARRVGDEFPATHDRVQDAQEVRLRAPVRFAVALDQPPAQRDLEREAEVALGGG